LAATSTTACSIFEPPPSGEDDAGSGAGGTSSNADGGAWWPYRNAHACESAGVPGPSEQDGPKTEGPGETDKTLPPIYLYLSKYRLSALDDEKFTADPNAWQKIGFDIDRTCKNSNTCTVGGAKVEDTTCAPHTAGTLPNDGDQCRDNMIGKLFYAAASSTPGTYFGETEADWNCEIRRGRMSVIFKISEYNGTPNDKQVRLDLYTSTGLLTPSLFACRSKLNGQQVEETIEGTLPDNWWKRAFPAASAHWRVTSESIALNADDTEGHDLKNAKWNDPAAYVRNGYLVARLPEGTEYWLNGKNATVPGFRLIVNRPLLVGKLSQTTEWQLTDAIFTGVVEPNALIHSHREFGFCENICGSYTLVVTIVTDSQDTLVSGAVQPSAKCNALTWAGEIAARQATVWKEEMDPPLPAGQYPPPECEAPKHKGVPLCPATHAGVNDSGARDGGT
jgi:hypothetical protein